MKGLLLLHWREWVEKTQLRQVEEMDSSNLMRDMKCQSSSSTAAGGPDRVLSFASTSLTVDYLMNRQKRGEGEEKLLSINQMGIYLFFNTDSSSSYQVLSSTSCPCLRFVSAPLPLACHCSSFVYHRRLSWDCCLTARWLTGWDLTWPKSSSRWLANVQA